MKREFHVRFCERLGLKCPCLLDFGFLLTHKAKTKKPKELNFAKRTKMKKELKIYFEERKTFEMQNIKPLVGLTGLYFIFTKKTRINYPFKKSRILYIGMSEKKTNSIGNRLSGHFDGKSKNIGLVNFRQVEQLYFTYINFEMLRNYWNHRVEDLESYFILDFVEKYGVYPICNNKTGFEILNKKVETKFIIDWKYFE